MPDCAADLRIRDSRLLPHVGSLQPVTAIWVADRVAASTRPQHVLSTASNLMTLPGLKTPGVAGSAPVRSRTCHSTLVWWATLGAVSRRDGWSRAVPSRDGRGRLRQRHEHVLTGPCPRDPASESGAATIIAPNHCDGCEGLTITARKTARPSRLRRSRWLRREQITRTTWGVR